MSLSEAQPKPDQRVDERDTMFARMERTRGTEAYDDYYRRFPSLRDVDDDLRSRPRLAEPGGVFYHPEITGEAERYFKAIDGIEIEESLVTSLRERLLAAENPGPLIKRIVLELGAVAVGFAPLSEEYIYTHKGRFDGDYGQEVALTHPSAIIFLVEMDHDEMRRAPRAEVIRESAHQYYRGAEIALTIEAVLRAAGSQAKAHYDAHYDIILPPLAVAAGLGELGRNNILVADRYGSRVRIAAISTDVRLDFDRPVSLGVTQFCEVCKKCADNCPSRALSLSGRETVRSVAKWPTVVERCYGYWRTVGTDCGICMAVCPFSHRNNWFHNLVRRTIRRLPGSSRFFLRWDDWIYGRKWRPKE